jgi:hypothetical protein
MKTIITEGGLLPADMLDAIAAGAVDGQRPEDFGMARTRPLSDRIAAAWQAARAQWALFQTHLADLPPHDSTATTLTREYWAIPLLRILGYTLERNRQAPVVAGRTYAISHRAAAALDAPRRWRLNVQIALADAWRLLHAPDDALAAAADAAALLPTVGSPKLTRRLIAIVRALPASIDRRTLLDALTPHRREGRHA